MAKTRFLLAASAGCLCLSVSLLAQTGAGAASGDSYFQTLVKEAKTRITEITAAKLGALQKEQPSLVLVDVREDNEWEKSRIPGAIHVGRGVLEGSVESKVPQKSATVVVYCRSGARSAVAADVLGKMGYAKVFSLAGGITAFEAAGLPVDKSSPPK
jgi:rhodanese-related sulfurtransferase